MCSGHSECPDSQPLVSDCFPCSSSSSSKNTGCLEFLVSSRVITCLPGLSKSHNTEQDGLNKGKRLIVREVVRGGQGGTEHVFEVALLIPIQMSESTWTGEEGAQGKTEGRGGEGGLSEGKTGTSATAALHPRDSSIVVANNFTFMVNDKLWRLLEKQRPETWLTGTLVFKGYFWFSWF